MAEIEVLVTYPDETYRYEVIEDAYRDIKALLNDGWLEALGTDGRTWVAYGDEEGNLKGLERNALATALLAVIPFPANFIPVGPVVFVGLRYQSPEDGYVETSLPESLKEKADRLFSSI